MADPGDEGLEAVASIAMMPKLFPLLAASGLILGFALTGCDGKASKAALAGFQDPDSLVTSLYDALGVDDGHGKKVDEDFLRYFSADLRPYLSETEHVNTFLCECHAYIVRDVDIAKYAPGRWVRVRVTEGVEDERSTTEMRLVLSRTGEGWLVSDIHYPEGYTLREALFPDSIKPAPRGETPRAAYLRLRERLAELPGGRWSRISDKYPRSKKEKRLREFDSLYAYLGTRIADAIPAVSVPGYAVTEDNNLLACPYDYCTSVDGRVLSPREEGLPNLIVTDRKLLEIHARSDRLPPNLEAFADNSTFLTSFIGGEAHFFPLFEIPVKSEGLSFVSASGGMFSQDGPRAWAESATLVVARGDRVFLANFGIPKHLIAECNDFALEESDALTPPCFAEKVRGTAYVDTVSALAQKIIDRIAQASP